MGVLRDQATDWPILIPSLPRRRPCHNWSFPYLAKVLDKKKLSCRVWKRSGYHQVLETKCDHLDVTMGEFVAWLQGQAAANHNPLGQYSRLSDAAYIDYKHMKDMFEERPDDLLQQVQWADFGLPDFDGKDSTIWIGSKGANTSGHQDSYGFNLVTQIEGRKLWVLFPPSDTGCLYPTRVPYEESSIFSQVHLGCPDVEKFPAVQKSHPVVVVLHPGQTLYVPRHWWHYVESLDPSISINVWVPHKEDKESHLTESVTRCLATNLLADIKAGPDKSLFNQLLNPTETLYPTPGNIRYLKYSVERVLKTPPTEIKKTRKNSNSHSICGEEDERNEDEIVDNNTEDYFHQFSSWVQSCRISQASQLPCLGYCEQCEGQPQGCVIDKREIIIDSDTDNGPNHMDVTGIGSNHIETDLGQNSQISTTHNNQNHREVFIPKFESEDMESCNATGRLAFQKRKINNDSESYEENDTSNTRAKKFKGSNQCHLEFGCSKPRIGSLSECSDADSKNFNCSILSLMTPFLFDHYLELMQLKATCSDNADSFLSNKIPLAPSSSSSLHRTMAGEKHLPCKCHRLSSFSYPLFNKNVAVSSSKMFRCKKSSSPSSTPSLVPQPPLLPSSSSLVTAQSITSPVPSNQIDIVLPTQPTVHDDIHYVRNGNRVNSPSQQPVDNAMNNKLDKIERVVSGHLEIETDYKSVENDKIPPCQMVSVGEIGGVGDSEVSESDSSLELDDKSFSGSPRNVCSSSSKAVESAVGTDLMSSLSDQEVMELFFDSVLHPSVVGKISNLMKAKCNGLLKEKFMSKKYHHPDDRGTASS